MAVQLLIWKFTRPSENPEEISNLLVLDYKNYFIVITIRTKFSDITSI